jgi:hypothetical protein
MASRRRLKESLTFSWLECRSKVPCNLNLSRMHFFALDLLHAELRLKRCEVDDCFDTDFDADWAYLAAVVPFLYSSQASIERDMTPSKNVLWFALRARCTWLMAAFSFWRSRESSNRFEGREAEKDGLEFVEETMHTLKLPVLKPSEVVLTPHLSSVKRKELHWHQLSLESLSSFSSEVQASSVVLQAREDFARIITKSESLEEIDFALLVSIGVPLLERYQSSVDSPTSKFTELVEDFFVRHGEAMLTESSQSFQSGDENRLSTWFESILRLDIKSQENDFELNTPSILSVILCCLDHEMGRRNEVMILLCRIVIVLVAQFEASPKCNKSLPSYGEQCNPFRETEFDMNIEFDLEHDNSKARIQKRTLKQRQYAMLIHLTIGKISNMYVTLLPTCRKSFLMLPEVSSLLQKGTNMASRWFFEVESIPLDRSIHDEDVEICSALNEFVKSLLIEDAEDVNDLKEMLKVNYVAGMLQILCIQRHLFISFSKVKPNIQSRPNRVRITRRRSELVGLVSCDLGLLLSSHLFTWNESSIKQSSLLEQLSLQQLASLVECILYFARLAFSSETNEVNHLATYLDSFGRDRLRIPLATAIFGLCGSAIASVHISSGGDSCREEFNLAEFYDSDCSSVRLVSGKSNSSKPDSIKNNILNIVILSVHCIQNVLSKLSEVEILGYSFIKGYVTTNGPILPLVLVREFCL